MKIKNSILALIVLVGFAQAGVQSNMAETKLTAEFSGSEDNKEIEIEALIKKIETIGYSTVLATPHLEEHYYNKFEEKNVEMLDFFAIVNKGELRPLLLANPDFGAYAPFNFLVYKTLDIENDDTTWYGHLAPDTMLDIIGEKDAGNRKAFHDMVGKWDTFVNKEMKPEFTKKFEHTKPLPTFGLTKMVLKFERPDDIEDFMEEFIGDHDGRFAKHNFIIAGFIDFKFEYDDREEEFEKYDAYWVSSLCHFEFSNSVFNRGMPEAAMFAPCSVYFYIPKGTNELHVGYANVNNWINALGFKDQKRIDYMKSIDAQITEIFTDMGFKYVKQEDAPAKVVVEEKKSEEPKVAKVEPVKVKAKVTKEKVVVEALKAQVKAMKAEIEALKAEIEVLKVLNN